VEVPCLVDKNGLQPTRIGALPPHLAALIQTNINVQALVVEAALTRKREHIYHAAMLEKVRAHIAEYGETEKKMQDPAIYGDPKQITKLSRRLKQLKPLVETYAQYQKLEQAVADAVAMKDDPELGPMAEEEAVKAREQMPVLFEKMKRLLVPKNPDDERSVIMEVRAGAGGDEAALFAAEQLRMYLKYCEKKGFAVEAAP
jgi:peptide chain release factor 1